MCFFFFFTIMMKQFKLSKTGHTVGHTLVKQLLKDPKVVFAAYRQEHPLEHDITLKVQTTSPTYTPEAAMSCAARTICSITQELKISMRKSLQKLKKKRTKY